jgi:hypothetical protein
VLQPKDSFGPLWIRPLGRLVILQAFRSRRADRWRAIRSYDAGKLDAPSERAKRRALDRLYREGGHDSFLEAGTYFGDTVEYFLPIARRIISVEIDPTLHADAATRFARYEHVTVLHGDALTVIPKVLAEDGGSYLVWLDGHCSGGVTGQGEEFEPAPSILEQLANLTFPWGLTVVIDDLRLFGRHPMMPSLESLIASARKGLPQAHILLGIDSLVLRVERASDEG